jgi:hypothetical protein
MPRELFNQPNQCHPILPYDPVTNRLSFFRITLFDTELPLDVRFPYQPGPGRPPRLLGPEGALVDLYGLKLGLPVSDLFSELLAEAPAVLHKAGTHNFRIGSNHMFLPAVAPNRRYSGAKIVRLQSDGKRLSGPDEFKYLIRSFGKSELAAIKAGNSVTRLRDRELLRFTLENKGRRSRAAYAFFRVGRVGEADEPIRVTAPLSGLTPSARGRAKSAFPTYEIGFISHFEQEWALTGYSRGSLVSAFTLAPSEELVLEVFTWDRSKLEEQREVTTEYERNVEASSLTKVSAQISRDLSETTDRSAGIGLGVSLPVQGVPVDLTGNGDVSQSIHDGMKSSRDSISEATSRASERFKTSRQVVAALQQEPALRRYPHYAAGETGFDITPD